MDTFKFFLTYPCFLFEMFMSDVCTRMEVNEKYCYRHSIQFQARFQRRNLKYFLPFSNIYEEKKQEMERLLFHYNKTIMQTTYKNTQVTLEIFYNMNFLKIIIFVQCNSSR